MIYKTLDFPDKEFATKQELFSELRKNVNAIIALKKSEVYKSHLKGSLSGSAFEKTAVVKGPHMKDGYIYPVINTTRYMDSHRDVHFDSLWNKSVKEQAGKIFYVADHELKVDNVIAWPSDVNMMVKSVPWSYVGKNYTGNTEALIYEIPKSKIVHEKARDIIKDKRPVQNSVRMMYIKVQLGMDSDMDEDKQYKDYYDKRISEIVNREVAETLGYFWGVEEAKIITEGSMVLLGSNDATPVNQKDIEPPAGTQNRAVKNTRVKALNNLLKVLKA